MAYFSGWVRSIVFENVEEAYYVIRMELDQETTAPDGVAAHGPQVVCGTIPGLGVREGLWFGFDGAFKKHKNYGWQLTISRAPVHKGTWTPEAATGALVGAGVNPKVVAQIRARFGDTGFVAALLDVKALETVPTFTPMTAGYVVSRWEAVQAQFKTLEFLQDLGLTSNRIKNIWKSLGDDAQKILSRNPWDLVRVEGLTFNHADSIALKLGLEMSDPNRTRGAVLAAVRTARQFGHMFVTTADVFREASKLVPGVHPQDVATALGQLHKDKMVVLDRRAGGVAVYEVWNHHLEMRGAELLRQRVALDLWPDEESRAQYALRLGNVGPRTDAAARATPVDLQAVALTAVLEWADQTKVKLTDRQVEGVVQALLSPVSILTGLPGTGKTLSTRAVVSILKDAKEEMLLAAPTGIAAKRLAQMSGMTASTLHMAFSAKGPQEDTGEREQTYAGIVGDSQGLIGDGSEGEWGYGAGRHHTAKVVIVDESSMVDQHLLYRLMSCTDPTCRILMVGDAAQLPSVGPGDVLRSMVKSGLFPVTHLTDIFRQAGTSYIVEAAHLIHHGQVPDLKSQDFKLLEVQDENKIVDVILKLADNFTAADLQFQVMSPKHIGTIGVTNLNANLRALLNPPADGKQELKIGDEILREGDKVMVTKNNYKLQILNGDIGLVHRLDRKNKEVEISLQGPIVSLVRIPFSVVPQHLRLAYASTVHKMQGQEVDVVIIPVHTSFKHQLQRNLLYTAVTRARSRVVLVGEREAIAFAVGNAKEDSRNTFFLDRLSPQTT